MTLSLISTPTAERDQGLSAATREAVLTTLTDTSPARDDDHDLRARHAVALAAALGEPTGFTRAETGLLLEWLDRLSGKSSRR